MDRKSIWAKLAMLFASLVLLDITWGMYFPNWSFTTGYLNISASMFTSFFFFALLVCIGLLFKMKKGVVIIFSLLFACVFALHAYFLIHPIDTTTEPIDILTLQTRADGQKLIVRKYYAKSGSMIHDTVKVKDYFIFRKFIEGHP